MFAVQLRVQKFLYGHKLSGVFVPNGRGAKEPGGIMARASLAGLASSGFCDDVRRRVQFEDASSDPYRVV